MVVRRQAPGETTDGPGAPILNLLAQRTGQPTIVKLFDGRELVAFDVAWGRDIGDLWEHVTTNCSPPQPGRPTDFFYMSDVISIVDPDTRKVLMEQTPDPGET